MPVYTYGAEIGDQNVGFVRHGVSIPRVNDSKASGPGAGEVTASRWEEFLISTRSLLRLAIQKLRLRPLVETRLSRIENVEGFNAKRSLQLVP